MAAPSSTLTNTHMEQLGTRGTGQRSFLQQNSIYHIKKTAEGIFATTFGTPDTASHCESLTELFGEVTNNNLHHSAIPAVLIPPFHHFDTLMEPLILFLNDVIQIVSKKSTVQK
ncbi:hypothetical protein AVEN_23179-1 [Araneus ventricosus]|uniref:Uncharacterized protein n=1 Tax=Araneus ventricosus TaxID=182803 RepID=A0A4Y2G7S2_ARAVE|nr:hypothetical protein AVEN_23179-1 [Araneus ventricosus]